MVIHCAALANTPTCEKNPALAHKLNVEVTSVLAELAADIPFVFFSTDLVFDGRAGNYDESAAVNPLSVYGKTKVDAERVVLANPKHTVVRTSLNFGQSLTGDRAFNEQMRRAVERGETLHFSRMNFDARFRRRKRRGRFGNWRRRINRGCITWRAASVCRGGRSGNCWRNIGRLNVKMEPGSIRDFRGLPRSPDTSLNCAKVQKLLSFPLPRI